MKLKAIEYKGGKCSICGYNTCPDALEFHHIDSTKKDFNISKAGIAWKRMLIELDKCILLCSNHHKEFHAGVTNVVTQVAQLAEHSPD